jgi:alginate O-acetyltransferase complex protein AlgI
MSMLQSKWSLRGWEALALLLVAVVCFWPKSTPRWTLMWAVAFAFYFGFKWLTLRRTNLEGVPTWRKMAYLMAWPGMDAEAFLDPDRGPTLPAIRPLELAIAALNLVVGVALILDPMHWFKSEPVWLFAWSGMIGYMLALHFGIFRLLSCLWRWRGIDAVPVMDQPLLSTSVASLWGKRWNTAFSDLIHRFWFRPFTRKLGLAHATWIGFGASGLIHEAVMSYPARGGWGGPTAYFLTQSLGILFERTALGKRWGLGRGFYGWLYAMVCLAVPVPFFLNQSFYEQIVVPFFRDVRGM